MHVPLVVFASIVTATFADFSGKQKTGIEAPVKGGSPIGFSGLCNGPNARTDPPAEAVVVDASGAFDGSYKTVAEGVANLPNSTTEQTLFVFSGVYNEQVSVPKLAGPLVMQGYTCDTTSYASNEVTITHAKAQKDIPPEIKNNRNYLTSTLGLQASNVKVYNFNVGNPAGKIKKDGQAVAIYADGADYGFYACNFTGYQDTLCAHKGRELYAKTYISGAVDFVFGQKAMAWFESCDIESIGEGWITANGNENATIASEYVFNNARLFGTGSTYLGRPWRPFARVVWQNSELGDIVNPEGWEAWDESSSTANVYFKEFNNSGPGSAIGKRTPFSGQLDAPVAIADILGKNYESEWWVDTNFV
ncbi:Pectinesterase [Phytophthora infestans]|uniref:Pectinesterase n=1 Tax=Phytophthora infestans TaxID=4787 RepID=A0A8S9U4V7_PHYIN|nr:Pectinesterase [Phytophthora infestans]KAF4135956.1 Pectinesterase [Phytophthora infestans]